MRRAVSVPREELRALEPGGDAAARARRARAGRRAPKSPSLGVDGRVAARPRAAPARRRRRPACRRPSPRAPAGRSPRSATAARAPPRRGRGRRAAASSRSRAGRRRRRSSSRASSGSFSGPTTTSGSPTAARGRERGERVLALAGSRRRRAGTARRVAAASPGEERGVDAVRRHRRSSRGATPYSSTTSRFVRSETASTWSARRAARGHDALERERGRARPIAVGSRSNERSCSVTTARAAPAERDRVLEVRELRPQAPQQARQRPGHAQLLRAGAAARSPRRPSGTSPGARVTAAKRRSARGRGQLAEQVRRRRSRRRCARGRARRRRSRSRELLVDAPSRRARHLGPRARRRAGSRPERARDARRGSSRRRSGRRTVASSPATSAIALPALVTTGQPQASASATGIPKPSYSEA